MTADDPIRARLDEIALHERALDAFMDSERQNTALRAVLDLCSIQSVRYSPTLTVDQIESAIATALGLDTT